MQTEEYEKYFETLPNAAAQKGGARRSRVDVAQVRDARRLRPWSLSVLRTTQLGSSSLG